MAGRFISNFYCKQGRVFARTAEVSLSSRSLGRMPPASDRYQGPDAFDNSKGPSSLQESIDGPERARQSKCQDEPGTAMFECVKHEHGRDCEQSKQAQGAHAARIRLR